MRGKTKYFLGDIEIKIKYVCRYMYAYMYVCIYVSISYR